MPIIAQIALIVLLAVLTSATAFAQSCQSSSLFKMLQATITTRAQIETSLRSTEVQYANDSMFSHALISAEQLKAVVRAVVDAADSEEPHFQSLSQKIEPELDSLETSYSMVGLDQQLGRVIVKLFKPRSLQHHQFGIDLWLGSNFDFDRLVTSMNQAREAAPVLEERKTVAAGFDYLVKSLLRSKTEGRFIRSCEMEKLEELLGTSFSDSVESVCVDIESDRDLFCWLEHLRVADLTGDNNFSIEDIPFKIADVQLWSTFYLRHQPSGKRLAKDLYGRKKGYERSLFQIMSRKLSRASDGE